MISGAVLLVAGIALIIPQFYIEMLTFSQLKPVDRSTLDASKGLSFTTSYVGVMVLGIGPFLEIVGYISTVPWRQNKNPD
jgi:hypothetical protein